MKYTITSILIFLLIATTSFGQAPEGFKYQAVIRDASNTILANQAVGIQLTIEQTTIGGAAVYTETFSPTTNAYGLVNLEIGTGTTSDDFSLIDWALGPFFIETAVDISGGTAYVVLGTSQLMSVPYALYAKTSGSSTPGPQGAPGLDGADGADGADGVPGTNFFSAMQGGTQNVGASGGLEIMIVNVVFTTPFVGTPSVICTASAQVGSIFDDSFDVTTRQVTSTGFTMIINRVDGSTWGQNMDVHWMAFE